MLPPVLRPALLALLAAVVLAAPAGAAVQPPTTYPLKSVSVNGATLGYRIVNPQAEGRALVLIPGYGVTAAEWDPQLVQTLAQGRRVVVYDNRGLGNSTGPVARLTVATMARDAAGLIRALKLGRPDVLGWSMGGYIGQRLAIDRPQLVHRLILASSDPGSPRAIEPDQATIAVLTNASATPTSLLPVLFPADRLADGQAWMAAIGAQPGLTAADFATPAATMREQNAATGPRWYRRGRGTYAQLSRVKARTLIAFGAEDVVVPPGNARLLARRIQRATTLRFADAGHAFLFQRPVAKARAFAAFLDGKRRSGR